jgi:hypothetical protein
MAVDLLALIYEAVKKMRSESDPLQALDCSALSVTWMLY